VSDLTLSLIGFVLLVLDASLGGLLTLGSVRPSLTLPFVVYVGLQRGPVPGTLFGAALGLGADLLGALPLGASSFAYAVVGFVCGKLWREGAFRLLWPWGTFLFVGAVFSELVAHYLISRGTGLALGPLLLASGLPAAVYTSVLGLLWFLSPLHRLRGT
jgi:rod shape-determining protein MreD